MRGTMSEPCKGTTTTRSLEGRRIMMARKELAPDGRCVAFHFQLDDGRCLMFRSVSIFGGRAGVECVCTYSDPTAKRPVLDECKHWQTAEIAVDASMDWCQDCGAVSEGHPQHWRLPSGLPEAQRGGS